MPLLPPWLHNVMPALPILLLAVCQQLPSGPGCHLWTVLSLCCPSDKRRRAFSLFSLFAAVCWHLHPRRVKLCCHQSCFWSATATLSCCQPRILTNIPFLPIPTPLKKNIYTPPTTETVHLSRLMRVHYNHCPFHKPASEVTDTF